MGYPDELEQIVLKVIEPNAVDVDRGGRFPDEGIEALSEAGILALTVPNEYGGEGMGLASAGEVVRRLGAVCGSTAMVATMHYAATAVLVATGRVDVLREIGARKHLTTLAFSEAGSRSHFWSPVSTARLDGDAVAISAQKSWVTSAHKADSYVWSTLPIREGTMSLWLMPSKAFGLRIADGFDGVGLRGNDSCAISAELVRLPLTNLLGADGSGLELAMGHALPWFLCLNAAANVGLMETVTRDTGKHVSRTILEHLDESLARQWPTRAKLAKMRVQTDAVRALVMNAHAAVDQKRGDAALLCFEAKIAAGEGAVAVADLAMQACGGAAFRKDIGIERRFRDSLASRVMAPTTDALLDFVGRTLADIPLLDA